MAAWRVADSSGFRRPYRPLPIAWANRVGGALARLGIGNRPIVADDLLEQACRQTGLSDFGDEAFVVPLRVLLRSIRDEARLNPIGQMIIRSRFLGILTSKLRSREAMRQHPEVLELPIRAPIVIAGLQRTGTTMLHRLIAADPRIRALASWEALNPAPKKPMRTRRVDPRVRQAVVAERGLAYMAPDFFAIHPVEANAPEEEIILLDQSFLSTSAEAMMRVPTYAAWLEQQDHLPAYRGLKRMLQYLQWQRPNQRWVLKTPHHLEFLDPLLEVFPDATVVQTHRDPLKTSASFFSMVTHARGIFSDCVDPSEVGEHWLRKIERMVTRAMGTRDRRGDEGFVDVSYYDLIGDPMAEVSRIYERSGWRLIGEARARIEASQKRNRRTRHGTHRYALEDFGLSEREVEPRLAAYRAHFGIPRE